MKSDLIKAIKAAVQILDELIHTITLSQKMFEDCQKELEKAKDNEHCSCHQAQVHIIQNITFLLSS